MMHYSRDVRTRGGTPVAIAFTDARGEFPVQGYIGDSHDLEKWTADGRYRGNVNGDVNDLEYAGQQRAALRVGEMYLQKESSGPPVFELVQSIAVDDELRKVLMEAGYDTEALFI